MGKTRKKFITQARSQKPNQHWLGHGIDGQEALLFDLDPYLYALDAQICRISQQIAYSTDERSGAGDRPKAAIILGYDLNPWTVGFLSDRYDVVLVTDFVDPIIEETASRFGAVQMTEEQFYSLEPVIDFALFFNCAESLDRELIKSAFEVSNVIVQGGVALFPTSTVERLSPDVKASWLKTTLGFREFTDIEVLQTSFKELKRLPDFGVTDFARRHREFYGKQNRDLCLRRIYEEDFQEAVADDEVTIELIVAVR